RTPLFITLLPPTVISSNYPISLHDGLPISFRTYLRTGGLADFWKSLRNPSCRALLPAERVADWGVCGWATCKLPNPQRVPQGGEDGKSIRLNSSHKLS